MSELVIRRADQQEALLLTQLAHTAKRHWGYPERWIVRWRDALTVTVEYIERHQVYVVERDARVVGFYGLRSDAELWRLDHLWVHPTYIGRGMGTRLFCHAVEQVAQARNGPLVIESDPFAVEFYLKMGAKRVGEVDASLDDVPRTLPVLMHEC